MVVVVLRSRAVVRSRATLGLRHSLLLASTVAALHIVDKFLIHRQDVVHCRLRAQEGIRVALAWPPDAIERSNLGLRRSGRRSRKRSGVLHLSVGVLEAHVDRDSAEGVILVLAVWALRLVRAVFRVVENLVVPDDGCGLVRKVAQLTLGLLVLRLLVHQGVFTAFLLVFGCCWALPTQPCSGLAVTPL